MTDSTAEKSGSEDSRVRLRLPKEGRPPPNRFVNIWTFLAGFLITQITYGNGLYAWIMNLLGLSMMAAPICYGLYWNWRKVQVEKRNNALQILLMSTGASILYASVNDQITVQICPEYFTVGHELIFGLQPLPILALLWGVCAGLFPGFALGVLLVIACNRGPAPIVHSSELKRPISYLLLMMGSAALIAGSAGAWLAETQKIQMPEIYANRVQQSKHSAFFADWFAHGAAYLVGYAGGLIIITRAWRRRRTVSGNTER
jgi:hypothetical protein